MKFWDWRHQAEYTGGLVCGYSHGSGHNISWVCDGKHIWLEDADAHTQSKRWLREELPDSVVAFQEITAQLALRTTWVKAFLSSPLPDGFFDIARDNNSDEIPNPYYNQVRRTEVEYSSERDQEGRPFWRIHDLSGVVMEPGEPIVFSAVEWPEHTAILVQPFDKGEQPKNIELKSLDRP